MKSILTPSYHDQLLNLFSSGDNSLSTVSHHGWVFAPHQNKAHNGSFLGPLLKGTYRFRPITTYNSCSFWNSFTQLPHQLWAHKCSLAAKYFPPNNRWYDEKTINVNHFIMLCLLSVCCSKKRVAIKHILKLIEQKESVRVRFSSLASS